MKNAFLFILLLFFSVASTDSSACSIFTNKEAKFHWSLFNGNKKLPAQPTVEVGDIIRAGDMRDVCSDVAILTITIPIDSSNPAFAYKFELVSGNLDPMFRDKPVLAMLRDGKHNFVFRWIESTAPPMDIVVKVTAYSRTGKQGGSTNIKISDRGR